MYRIHFIGGSSTRTVKHIGRVSNGHLYHTSGVIGGLAMEILLAVGIGVAVAWIIGFVRAVRREPINRRLNTYCRRGE